MEGFKSAFHIYLSDISLTPYISRELSVGLLYESMVDVANVISSFESLFDEEPNTIVVTWKLFIG